MKRNAYNSLIEWKKIPDGKRKPLILNGARQVGKTWLLEEFGKNEFESVAEINFEKQPQMASIFAADFDVNRIIRAIQLATGVKLVPGKTLIIFDEIQDVERGLLSLKYIFNDAPEYHIVAAGSLLGITLKQESFPVGKVDFLNINPLSFDEFLIAMHQDNMVEALKRKDWELISAFKSKYIDFLRQYYFVGGMPEVVEAYSVNQDFEEVRDIQKDLLMSYERDFSKHPPFEIVPKIKQVWEHIPAQLAKENKKFVYNVIRKGARAKEFEGAIEWLSNAGAVHKVTRISKSSVPIKGFEDMDSFKLYIIDIGLLGAMSGLDARTLINGNEIFEQYKGALTEQYVLQQLKCIDDLQIHYWTPDAGMAEIDFVVQSNGRVIPIEVKAEENLKSKSLKSYREKYSPEVSVRTCMSDYKEQEDLVNIPLYAILYLEQILFPKKRRYMTVFQDDSLLKALLGDRLVVYEPKPEFKSPTYDNVRHEQARKILEFVSEGPHSSKEILEKCLEVLNNKNNREKYIKPLLEKELIIATTKGLRAESKQRYMCTNKGKCFISYLNTCDL